MKTSKFQNLNFDSIEVLSKNQQQKITGGTTKWCCKESATGYPPYTSTCFGSDDKTEALKSCQKGVNYPGSWVTCYQIELDQTCT